MSICIMNGIIDLVTDVLVRIMLGIKTANGSNNFALLPSLPIFSPLLPSQICPSSQIPG